MLKTKILFILSFLALIITGVLLNEKKSRIFDGNSEETFSSKYKILFLFQNQNSFLAEIVDTLKILTKNNELKNIELKLETDENIPKNYQEALSFLKSSKATIMFWEKQNLKDENIYFLMNADEDFDKSSLLKLGVHYRKGCLSRNKQNLVNWILSLDAYFDKDIKNTLMFTNLLEVKKNKCYEDILFHKVFCHYMLENNEEVKRISEQILEINPNHLKALWILSRKEISQDRERYLNRIIEINDGFADVYADLGELEYSKDTLSQAIEMYEKAIEIAPDVAEYYYKLAEIYLDIKDYQKAEDKFIKSIVKDSTNYLYYYRLGQLLIYTPGEFEEKYLSAENQFMMAVHNFEKAIELNPEAPAISYELGSIFFNSLSFELAIKHFHQFLDSVPDNVEVTKKVAIAYQKINDDENAKKYYLKACELDSSLNTEKFRKLFKVD